MEGNLNKDLILTIVKYSSWVIGLSYLIQTIVGCFGVQIPILSLLFAVSIVPAVLLIIFSKFLNFCIWNRLPLYYAISINLINFADYYLFGIPNKIMLVVYLILLGLFVLYGAYIKNRINVNKRNTQNSIT